MDVAEVADLTGRVAELETTVRLLAVMVGLLAAVLLTAAILAALWMRSRHVEVMKGIGALAEGQEEIKGEVRAAEMARAIRDGGALIH